MSFLRPLKLSREAFKACIAERGWRMADVACRWAIRPEHLSRIAADEQRDTKWDDLVRSLPGLTRREQAAVTAARLELVPRQPRHRTLKTAEPAPASTDPVNLTDPPFTWDHGEEDEDEALALGVDGFRYQTYLSRGSELVVVQAIDGFAREHSILVVMATRIGADVAGGAQEEYQCESATGQYRWFEPEQIDDWLVSNGKMRELR